MRMCYVIDDDLNVCRDDILYYVVSELCKYDAPTDHNTLIVVPYVPEMSDVYYANQWGVYITTVDQLHNSIDNIIKSQFGTIVVVGLCYTSITDCIYKLMNMYDDDIIVFPSSHRVSVEYDAIKCMQSVYSSNCDDNQIESYMMLCGYNANTGTLKTLFHNIDGWNVEYDIDKVESKSDIMNYIYDGRR